MTVGDLRPRLNPGARGELWDLMASAAGGSLLAERLASSGGALRQFLEVVADAKDNAATGRDALVKSMLLYILHCLVRSSVGSTI